MPIDRLNQYRKGLKVERIHTMPHLIPYNNGYHSANAALIAHELCTLANINSASVVMYMLLHDVAEGYVGDIPSNVKLDYPRVKQALDEAEHDWEERHIPDMPDLSHQERGIAKVSDAVELGMHCLDEIAMGNTTAHFILNNVINMLHHHEKDVVGCDTFIRHLIKKGV